MRNVVIFAIFCGLSVWAVSAPKPVLSPKPGQWTLDVQYSQPHQISLRLAGNAQPQRYWYVVVTLTNTSSADKEIPFYPACELVTDNFQTVSADKSVPKAVFEQIRIKHQGQYPFLESLDFSDRTLRFGQDNRRDIVVIWPDFDSKARQISLYLAGLSNETAVIPHPLLKDEQNNPKQIYLQKTLQLTYALGTDPALRSQAGLTFVEQNWVMR